MRRTRRPFWLPASNYYVLTVAVSAVFFFLVWGILHDGGEETPWITAGIGASILMIGAVILREVILRRARARLAAQQRSIDSQFRGHSARSDIYDGEKLTLELNAAILGEIKQKSSAANVFAKVSAGHREVFELCSEYLARNEIDLKNVKAGSPRLAPLLRGRSTAGELHRFHMLKWAEIEARAYAAEARSRPDVAEKMDAAQSAISVVDTALASYPEEDSLRESRQVLGDLLVSINVSHLVEQAEKAAFKGEYSNAKSIYKDALFYLGRDNVQSDEREEAAEKILAEIERIRLLEKGA
ncbi:MAG: hypothetical protein IPM59_08980 [Chloracidobacterium sp.]|nr:hypothetical protein [Chloracidobacterium sp.]